MISESNLLFWQKYTPKDLFDEKDIPIRGNDITLGIIRTRAVSSRPMPHALFLGPPGTGKSTTGRAVIAYKLDVPVDSIENDDRCLVVDCSGKGGRSIDNVATLKHFVKRALVDSDNNDRRYMLLEEFDNASSDMQKACRIPFEKFSDRVTIILTANESWKIIKAIKDRCFPLRFGLLSDIEIGIILDDFCPRENIELTPEARQLIIRKARGSVRKTLNFLDWISGLKNPIGPEIITAFITIKQFEDLIASIFEDRSNVKTTETIARNIYRKTGIKDFMGLLSEFIMQDLMLESDIEELRGEFVEHISKYADMVTKAPETHEEVHVNAMFSCMIKSVKKIL